MLPGTVEPEEHYPPRNRDGLQAPHQPRLALVAGEGIEGQAGAVWMDHRDFPSISVTQYIYYIYYILNIQYIYSRDRFRRREDK